MHLLPPTLLSRSTSAPDHPHAVQDTKNYVDGKKTVKVAVKEETQSWRKAGTEKRTFGGEDGYGTGTYNMMDDTRAPVNSGSYQEALFKKKRNSVVQEKVEAPKVFGAGLKVAQAVGGVSGGAGVLPDINKYKRPSKTLILYEYEGSPYCKKVRDACSLLDLVVEYRPCPSARYGHSDQLATRTQGDRTVPYFVDPNNAIGALNSSNDADKIVEYLFDYFGPGAENIPANLKKKLGGNAASYTGGAGGKLISNYKQDNIFRKPIDLWGYEGAPAVKPVRETLCGLALAHRFIHCSKGSSNIAKLTQKAGRFEVPYIEDPNTGKKIFGGAEIVKYLTTTYTA